VNRRELLRSWRLWAAALAAGAAGPTLTRWLRPVEPTPAETWVDAGRLGELDPDGWRVRNLEVRRRDRWRETVRAETVYLRRRGDEVEALSAVCPHGGCLVRATDGAFSCPCHGGRFDAEGARVAGPPRRGLDPLPVRVERGRIQVRHRVFRAGVAEREPVSG